MTTRWTLIRDRALQLEATGIAYDRGWEMAENEISDRDPRIRSSAGFSNDAAIRQKRQVAGARKVELRKEFQRLVRGEVEKGLSYERAFHKVTRENVTLCNSLNAPLPAETAAPVANSAAKALLGLCPDCTQDEFSAAWNSNGGKVSPVDHLAIARGLTDAAAAKNSWPPSTAAGFVKNRHPLLRAVMDAAGQ